MMAAQLLLRRRPPHPQSFRCQHQHCQQQPQGRTQHCHMQACWQLNKQAVQLRLLLKLLPMLQTPHMFRSQCRLPYSLVAAAAAAQEARQKSKLWLLLLHHGVPLHQRPFWQQLWLPP